MLADIIDFKLKYIPFQRKSLLLEAFVLWLTSSTLRIPQESFIDIIIKVILMLATMSTSMLATMSTSMSATMSATMRATTMLSRCFVRAQSADRMEIRKCDRRTEDGGLTGLGARDACASQHWISFSLTFSKDKYFMNLFKFCSWYILACCPVHWLGQRFTYISCNIDAFVDVFF